MREVTISDVNNLASAVTTFECDFDIAGDRYVVDVPPFDNSGSHKKGVSCI